MPTIFYSLAGEGLGHASRTQAVLEHLDPNIIVYLFTWGDAYNFFEKQNYPNLHKIIGIPFGRNENNKISHIKTSFNLTKFLYNYSDYYKQIIVLAKQHNPDLFISDYEPIGPRVANNLSIPLLSIDNQHQFSCSDLSELPWKMRSYAKIMDTLNDFLVPNPDAIVISTLYKFPLKADNKAIMTDCFIRKILDEQVVSDQGYLLVYYKPSISDVLLDLLSQFDSPIKVYGCPVEKRVYSKFEYSEVSGENFARDLAGCHALFSSSGSQLLGEAAYLGKPVFTIPEPNQPEQEFNALCTKLFGYGDSCSLKKLDTQKIKTFLNSVGNKREDISSTTNGVHAAISVLYNLLHQKDDVRSNHHFRPALRQ